QRIAAENAAEDVDQHGLYVGIAQQNTEGILNLLRASAAAHIQKVGGTAAGELNDVHGRHGETCTVDHATDRSVQLDIVQPETRSLHFERIFLVEIAKIEQLFVAIERVVVEIQFGIERVDLAVLGENERIDLRERSIHGDRSFGQRRHGANRGVHAGRRNAHTE